MDLDIVYLGSSLRT